MSKHMRTDAAFEEPGSTRGGERRGRGLKVFFALLIFVLILGLVACGFLLGRSVAAVRAEASSVKEHALVVADAALTGDAERLTQATSQLTASVDVIDGELSGFLWNIASYAPVVGTDITCAREVADIADGLCEAVLVPFVEEMAGTSLADLVEGHTVNCEVLRRIEASISSGAPVVADAARRLSALKTGSNDEISTLVESLREPVYALDAITSESDALFAELLAMLGDGGNSRTYILAALGNSELRASGGMPGSIGVMRVTDGAIELTDFTSVHTLQSAVWEHGFVARASADELQALGTDFVSDASFCTAVPDFPRVGEVLSEMWEETTAEHVDGVIAMDPVFLGRVLSVTGGITAADGTFVDGENCAFELLSNAYWRYGYETNGNEMEDAFFADVAHKSFDRLFESLSEGGAASAAKLVQVFSSSGEDRRLQVWMASDEEQQLMQRLGVTGSITTDGHESELGIYVNDISWNKLCWYLNIYYDLERGADTEDGRATFEVAVHFTNSITADEASRAPAYISQMYQVLKRAPSDLVETILIMAPSGGSIDGYEVHPDAPIGADKTVPDEHLALYGRDTWRSRINILGEGDTYVTFTLTMPQGGTTPKVVTSPLCHD